MAGDECVTRRELTPYTIILNAFILLIVLWEYHLLFIKFGLIYVLIYACIEIYAYIFLFPNEVYCICFSISSCWRRRLFTTRLPYEVNCIYLKLYKVCKVCKV